MDSEEFAEQLEVLMTEAVELRSSVAMPKVTDQADEILDRLYKVRQQLDRLEEIMRQVNRMKFLAERQKAASQAAADDDWATALSKLRSLPTFRNESMIGPREKYAEADLSTMKQKRALRKAEDLLNKVTEANEFIRTCYFGLNGVREDIKYLMRTLTTEARIER